MNLADIWAELADTCVYLTDINPNGGYILNLADIRVELADIICHNDIFKPNFKKNIVKESKKATKWFIIQLKKHFFIK